MDPNQGLKKLVSAIARYDERVMSARDKYHSEVNKIIDNIRKRKMEEVRQKITGT